MGFLSLWVIAMLLPCIANEGDYQSVTVSSCQKISYIDQVSKFGEALVKHTGRVIRWFSGGFGDHGAEADS